MRIAVIGSGISGLTAAHILCSSHSVTVYESAAEIGGHTATREVSLPSGNWPVDTGFIVYNHHTYPNFVALLDSLGSKSQPTDMGFSVTCKAQDFEYCGSSLNGLFADRRNLLRPDFLGMLRDIALFNRQSKRDLESGRISPDTTLAEYLHMGGYGELFVNAYILPMVSAIWSTAGKVAEEFQALFFVRFFNNHGLLNLIRRPRWRVVAGGSKQYLAPLVKPFQNRIRVNSAVTNIVRTDRGAVVETKHDSEHFDHVVLACHSDQALAILDQPSTDEAQILGAIPYRSNRVTLHLDQSILPRRRRAWTSWNYLLDDHQQHTPVVTYNMNILQSLPAPETICVTVNGEHYLDPGKVIESYYYAHPQLDHRSLHAQARWHEINGLHNTSYCGAYWRNGFHEDGVASAIRACQALGAKWPIQ